MDKLVIYSQLIKKILSEYHALSSQPAIKYPDDHVVEHLLIDDEHYRYMLFRVGWWESKRIRSAVIYVYLQDGKIWIEEDWTENGIATDLLAAGVPKEDIILAFHSPDMQEYSEFAAA